ncbi:VG15 protein [Nocardia sp. MW-W600-9]
MIEPTALTVWAAQVARLIVRYMTTYGVPTTRDQRWALARRLHPTVEQMRREAYARTSAQLRAEGLRPAPMAPYRPSALVAAIERATDAEPYVRPGRRDEVPLERVDPQTSPAADPESTTEPAPERTPERTAERRARVRVTAPAQQPRPRVQVRVAANDLDPRSRSAARSRVVVTDDNRRDPVVVRTVTERVTATVERHIRQVDRETIVETANSSADEIGWARVLSGAENCAFCAMLASRGPVYRSDKSALSVVGDRRGRTRGSRELGERYHDHCDCDAVLVREGQDWAGREEFERLRRMWVAASAAHGDDTTRAFNRSWRRIQRHPELEDEYDRLWAESTAGLTDEDEQLRAFAAAVKEHPPAALEAARRPRRAPDDTADSSAAA